MGFELEKMDDKPCSVYDGCVRCPHKVGLRIQGQAAGTMRLCWHHAEQLLNILQEAVKRK